MADESETGNPDSFEKQDAALEFAVRGIRSKVAFWTVVVALVLVVIIVVPFWLFVQQELPDVPDIKEAWIVSRIEGTDVASTEPKIARDGLGVMLYIVAYGYDEKKNDYFYYMKPAKEEAELPRLIIEGEEIPPGKIRVFDVRGVECISFWYKVEISPTIVFDNNIPLAERQYWQKTPMQHTKDRWWAVADVRSDRYRMHLEQDKDLPARNYLYEHVGTNYFVASLVVYDKERKDVTYARMKTNGAEPETEGGLPPGAHRVTILPQNERGPGSAYRAFLNLYAYQEDSPEPSQRAIEMARSFTGGDSRSVLIAALRLYFGNGVSFEDMDFLVKIADRIYDAVCAEPDFGFVRSLNKPDQPVPINGDGIRAGDILVMGDRYMVFAGENEYEIEPFKGYFNTRDLVYDAYNDFVKKRPLDFIVSESDRLQVWRLKRAGESGSGGR
jgi:hypothetical protein